MRFLSAVLFLGACAQDPVPTLDLTERLGPREVRAGFVTDEGAFFGGISAEGQRGDVKIYNGRVQFVIQGARPGNYYVTQGGGVVDADIVRPEGQPGRDIVDEWMGMFGLGRVLDPERIVVLDPGFTGRARVLVEGPATPMQLIEGALEAPGFIQDLGLWVRTEYHLRPESWFLEVRTTITAEERDVQFAPGDVILGAPEVAELWQPGLGRGASSARVPWKAYTGRKNDVAVMIASEAGETFGDGGGAAIIAELTDMVAGFGDELSIPRGESRSFTRYYGVGPDLATLTDALQERDGVATEKVTGQVEAADGPVAGARVNVLVDGAPYTLAVTDADGRFAAQVPVGADAEVLAVGRSHRRFFDLPEGSGNWAPYAAPGVLEGIRRSLEEGAIPVPFAEGRGVGTPEDPLVLGVPAEVTVTAADGLPFEVRAYRESEAVDGPSTLIPEGPGGGAWAVGWAQAGEVTLLLEPGDYRLVAHRGIRFGQEEALLTVAEGEAREVAVSLPRAYEHPEWILGDPHSHASPSGDGRIPMEERLLVHAGVGIQLHFGTDHDHIADYRPLLAPLGLEGRLGSIVADEVSPVLRGHYNVYPIEPDPGLPNHGAWPWWREPVPDTETQMAILRDRHPEAILQSNHPWGNGLSNAANWSPGHIGRPDFWSSDIDAVEVMNRGNVSGLTFYLDLINRGILVAPVGVSDSHGHTDGTVGYSATFLGVGSNDPLEVTPDALREAMRERRTVVTRGPFLDLSIPPGSTVIGSATLEVEAHHPAWMQVDELILLRDGEEVERIEGSAATFSLAPEVDASYVVIAEGGGELGATVSNAPWAMSSAILVDVDGDGWDPPLPPFSGL